MIVVSHFYNEEYLLPHWLNHHKKIFDHGIMINYKSTDRSVEIIKEICPTWEVVDSRNQYFGAADIDKEVMDIERNLTGFRMALNTTEFLLGKVDILKEVNRPTQIIMPAYCMVDHPSKEFTEIQGDLIKDRFYGFDYEGENFKFKMGRSLHNVPVNYPLGRHYLTYNTKDFVILWYGFSPYNERLLGRKLQIQNKMPQSDKDAGLALHHVTTAESLYQQLQEHRKKCRFLNVEIDKYLSYTFPE